MDGLCKLLYMHDPATIAIDNTDTHFTHRTSTVTTAKSEDCVHDPLIVAHNSDPDFAQ